MEGVLKFKTSTDTSKTQIVSALQTGRSSEETPSDVEKGPLRLQFWIRFGLPSSLG